MAIIQFPIVNKPSKKEVKKLFAGMDNAAKATIARSTNKSNVRSFHNEKERF